MRYHIKSAGKEPESEYRWVSKDNQNVEPDCIMNLHNHGVDPDACSLVIIRSPDDSSCLHLLMKSPDPSGRCDHMRRIIYNYFYVSAENESENDRVQHMAAHFLSDSDSRFMSSLNSCVIEDDSRASGFRVDIDMDERLRSCLDPNLYLGDTNESYHEINKNSDSARKNLVHNIKSARLKNKTGILVLVSDHYDSDFLRSLENIQYGLYVNKKNSSTDDAIYCESKEKKEGSYVKPEINSASDKTKTKNAPCKDSRVSIVFNRGATFIKNAQSRLNKKT